MESHFLAENNSFPISQNAKKTTLLATDRTYDINEYDSFREKYKDKELELCLYDDNINEDKDWFDLYRKA